jgi:hypothetical protein
MAGVSKPVCELTERIDLQHRFADQYRSFAFEHIPNRFEMTNGKAKPNALWLYVGE